MNLKKNKCIKKLLKWANKKQNNIYNDIIILQPPTKNLYDMIYSSWYTERDRPKLVILGHILPFNSPNPQKNKKKDWKKEKKISGNISIQGFPKVFRTWGELFKIW